MEGFSITLVEQFFVYKGVGFNLRVLAFELVNLELPQYIRFCVILFEFGYIRQLDFLPLIARHKGDRITCFCHRDEVHLFPNANSYFVLKDVRHPG